MDLERQVLASIIEECEKLITRYQEYHNKLHLDYVRKKERMSGVPPKIVKRPEYWAKNRLFNPFYVRRKARSIARSLASKIQDGTYTPAPPHIQRVPKSSGGTRNVSVYQVPDAAVSKLFYRSLLTKNRHRFSSFAYAYRNDRNVHFAIQDIAIDLQEYSRTFVAEFDFSDFFGSISHSFLERQFGRNGFSLAETISM